MHVLRHKSYCFEIMHFRKGRTSVAIFTMLSILGFYFKARYLNQEVLNKSFDVNFTEQRPSIDRNAFDSFDDWLKKWGKSMLNLSKAYGKGHYEGDLFQQNGTHFIKIPQIRKYFYLVQDNKASISRICETGFHEGHSALMWAILFNGVIDIISFDLCHNKHCEIGIGFIKRIFPSVKLSVIRGDSRTTVVEFSRTKPDIKCNLISIDGGHVGDVPKKDMENMKYLAARKHFVVVDDANSDSKLSWLKTPGKAWEDSVKEQLICPLSVKMYVIR